MIAETSEFTPVLMFLAGCGLLTMLLLRRSFRYFRGRGRGGGSGPPIELLHRPTSEWDGAYGDASASIERQKVELHEFARDAAGQLNSKLMMLDQLLRKSDRQIERMEALLAQLDEAKPSLPVIGNAVD